MAQPSSNSPTDGHQYTKDQTDLEISENVAESERELIEGVVLHETDKNVVHFEDIKSDGGNVDQDNKLSEGNRDQDNKSDDGDGDQDNKSSEGNRDQDKKSDDGDGDQDNTSGGGNGDLDNRSDEENGDQDNKSGEGNGDQDNKSDGGNVHPVPSHLPTSITAIKVQPPSSYTKPLISGDSVANSAQWRCTSCTLLNHPSLKWCEACSSSRPSMSTATPGSPQDNESSEGNDDQDDNIVYPQFQNEKIRKRTKKAVTHSVPARIIHDDSEDMPKRYSDDYALSAQTRKSGRKGKFVSKPYMPAFMVLDDKDDFNTDSESDGESDSMYSMGETSRIRRTRVKSHKGPVLSFGHDILSQMIYEKALKEGKETDKSIRLMIIGCHGQGKTSLLRCLLEEPRDDVKSTNGIDICKCTCEEDGTRWKRQLSDNTQNETIKRIAGVVKKTVPDSIRFKSTLSQDLRVDKLSEHLEQMSSLKRNSEDEIESVNIWDFGGQFVYYATHQLFHTRKAIYLLVFNLCEDLSAKVDDEDFPQQKDEKKMGDYIEFWLNSIHSFVGNEEGTEPAVILVGTHADQLENMEEADKYFESVRNMFGERKLSHHIQKENYAISTTDPALNSIESLRKTIISIGKRQKEGETIPAKWIPLERALRDCRNKNIIPIEEVLQIDQTNEYPIGNEEEVKSFLEFHHTTGTFFYFNEGEMSRHVVINPQFLIHAFRCIITSQRFCSQIPKLRPLWHMLTEKAILDPVLLYSVWKNESEEFIKFQDVLTAYLKKHRIIGEVQQMEMTEESHTFKPLGYYIVPSLLRKTEDGSVREFLKGKNVTEVSLVYEFENEAVVPTIFQRLTAAATGTWSVLEFQGKPLIYEDVSIYKIDLSHAGMLLHRSNKIEILVISLLEDEDVSKEIANHFRRFTELMIGAEFQKLRPLESDVSMKQRVKECFRCLHEKHDCFGSVTTYQLDFIQNVKSRYICCPDHVSHDSLHPREMQNKWFNNFTPVVNIPKKRLSDKEYSILSTSGVGYGWEQLGFHLGIEEKKIEQIDLENKAVSMKIFRVFKTWDMINADEATLDVLFDLVSSLPRNIINPDTFNNIIDKFY